MPDRTPLSTLLSWVWVAHTIEIDNAVEAVSADRVGRCVRISLPMWTNGLRHIDEDGVTVDQLHARARAVCNIGGLERWGWISVGDAATERRKGYGTHRGVTADTVLRPTRAGRYARRVWPQVVDRIEGGWRTRFGGSVIDTLRAALPPEPTLPWSAPEVNPSDGFRTRVLASPGSAEPEPPLAALLGQALTAVTLEHERDAEVALPLSANLLRVVDTGAVPLRDLPRLGGVSREAVAMAVTYVNRLGLTTTDDDRALSLTPDGLDALDGYRHRSALAGGEELRSALDAVLAQTAGLSQGLTPQPGCWRAEKPYLAQTRRLLADPTAALPWQPMVLHRGGWPDGS